jgi:hypothetical protein
MRINLNTENRISIKRLTDAELNRSATTNQTHIGLSDKSLTFMGDRKRTRAAILVHKNSWFAETCDIGKISRKNGSHNAPKISMGNRNKENLVKRIRKIASTNTHTHYMMWFASDTNTPVFWIIRKGSADYKKLKDIIDFNSVSNRICTFDSHDREFSNIVDVINGN